MSWQDRYDAAVENYQRQTRSDIERIASGSRAVSPEFSASLMESQDATRLTVTPCWAHGRNCSLGRALRGVPYDYDPREPFCANITGHSCNEPGTDALGLCRACADELIPGRG